MRTRSLVLTLTLSLPLAMSISGCMARAHETPSSSLTSTTQSTNATAPTAHEPHFLVSDQIYESCQLANTTNSDVAAGTAQCMKTGPLKAKRVRVMGSRDEVEKARDRLVGHGVEINRIDTVYEDGPATIDVIENTLGKRKRSY